MTLAGVDYRSLTGTKLTNWIWTLIKHFHLKSTRRRVGHGKVRHHMSEELSKSVLEVERMGKVIVYRSSFEDVIGDEASIQGNKLYFQTNGDKLIEAKIKGDTSEFWTKAAIRLLQDKKGEPRL
jgi:hypothetical protein